MLTASTDAAADQLAALSLETPVKPVEPQQQEEEEEAILKHNPRRFVLFPIQFHEVMLFIEIFVREMCEMRWRKLTFY